VVDSFGRALRFTYQGEVISTVTDPSGRAYRYQYGNPETFLPPRLVQVTYPDATPTDPANDPSVTYLFSTRTRASLTP
jgi:hypothetical protein